MGPARIHRYDAYHPVSSERGLPELALWLANATHKPAEWQQPPQLRNHPLLQYVIDPAGHSPKAWDQSPFKVRIVSLLRERTDGCLSLFSYGSMDLPPWPEFLLLSPNPRCLCLLPSSLPRVTGGSAARVHPEGARAPGGPGRRGAGGSGCGGRLCQVSARWQSPHRRVWLDKHCPSWLDRQPPRAAGCPR